MAIPIRVRDINPEPFGVEDHKWAQIVGELGDMVLAKVTGRGELAVDDDAVQALTAALDDESEWTLDPDWWKG